MRINVILKCLLIIFFVILSIVSFVLVKEFLYYKHNLDNKETITFREYLHVDKKPWHVLNTSKEGNVLYRGKTVLSESNKKEPLNDNSAYTTIEILVLFQARGIKPKRECNLKDTVKNGTFGCYMQFPEEN